MRWLLIALVVIGAAFVVLMIFAPDRGHYKKGDPLPKAPGWTKGLGSLVSGFAPGIEEFADGGASVTIAKDSSETRDAVEELDTETRILKLKLKSGGPVRIKLECRFAPGAKCSDTQVLCLGSRMSGCDDQEEVTSSGSFSVTAGGGKLTFETSNSQAAVVEID